jgi:group I intron endonuclease
MWINKLNNKRYVGSSVNLRRRLLEYYNINRLLRESSRPINLAILEHGFSNFSFAVLEFCNIKDLMGREKYYFELLIPEYNVLKIPGNPIRRKHSASAVEKKLN